MKVRGVPLGFHANWFSLSNYCREWYSYHFPELIKIVPDNQMYARVARYIGDRKSLNEEKMEGLEEIVLDSTKAQAIVEAARMSMGELEEVD